MSNIIQNISAIFTQYWLDLLIGTIAVFSIIRGIQKGALGSLFSLFGWLGAIVLAFLAQPVTADFIRDYTPVYGIISKSVQQGLADEVLGKSSLVMTQYLKLPEVLDNAILKASQTLAYSLTESITVLAINILTFICLVLLIKLILFLLNEVIATARKVSIIRGFDRILGAVVGAARAIIIAAVIMALLVPVLSVTNSQFLSKSITQSRIAKEVYDRNYLFFMVRQVGGYKTQGEVVPMEDMENNEQRGESV